MLRKFVGQDIPGTNHRMVPTKEHQKVLIDAVPGYLREIVSKQAAEILTAPDALNHISNTVPGFWPLVQEKARITSIQRETADTSTVTLRPSQGRLRFQAGQFIQLGVEVDGVVNNRCYSISSSQESTDATFTITIKIKHEGRVSTYMNRRASIGDFVSVSQPRGEFTLPKNNERPLVMISGGSGITPVMSMLRTLRDRKHSGPVAFLHYAPGPDSVIFSDELDRIDADHKNIHIVRCYTTHNDETSISGHFHPDHISKLGKDFESSLTFLCGPPSLVESVRSTYTDLGRADDLQIEYFAPPEVQTPESAEDAEVKFVESMVVGKNSGKTLLEQAEAAGLTPVFGCRMGICFSCTQTKLSGRTCDVRDGTISSDGEERIRICISTPIDDVELDM